MTLRQTFFIQLRSFAIFTASMASLIPILGKTDIIRDGSIGPADTTIQPEQPTSGQFVIPESQGKLTGANLFHSFREFNLDTGQSATFTGISPINNVIGRITDVNPSLINGSINSEIPGANLYLINPRGFVFGKGASLNVPGAFHVSTADSLAFSQGERAFEARLGGYVPILAAAAPTDFGLLGATSGNIRLNGAQLDSLRDVLVYARKILMDGDANITTRTATSKKGGDIQLTASERILLTDKSGGKAFFGAKLHTRTAGNGAGGSINLNAPVVEIRNGAQISTLTKIAGNGSGGEINITATEQFLLSGKADGEGTASQLFTTGEKDATSSVGGITVNAGSISIENGARVISNTQGEGDAGDIHLIAKNDITVDGTSNSNQPTIDDDTVDEGNSGNVVLSATNINIINGAIISTRTEGGGEGGNIALHATVKILLEGTFRDDGTLNASTSKDSTNTAGSILLDAPIVELTRGAKINSSTQGDGDGGDITIKANHFVSLSGVNSRGRKAQLLAASAAGSTGKTGNINVEAGEIRIDGGIISSNTGGGSDGGNINLTTAGKLRLSNNAKISSASSQEGDAGQITINTNGEVFLTNSTISTQAAQAGGGDINVTANDLIYLQDSAINTNVATGVGNSGNIKLDSSLVFLNSVKISANADAGSGGAIQISADNFYATPDTVIDASAGPAGIDGEVIISAPNVELQQKLANLHTPFIDVSSLMRPACSSFSNDAKDRSSSLRAEKYRGLPLSPEGMLLAFDNLDPDTDVKNPVVLTAMNAGRQAFRGGNYQQAREHLHKANSANRESGTVEITEEVMRTLAQAQQAMGNYAQSVATLAEVLKYAYKSSNPDRIASALGNLGNAYLALGKFDEADKTLRQALTYAYLGKIPEVTAVILNNRGNLLAARRNLMDAAVAYQESAQYSHNSGDALLEAKALSNKVRVLLQLERWERVESDLFNASAALEKSTLSHDKIYTLIHLAKSYQHLSLVADKWKEKGLLDAAAILDRAAHFSRKLGDHNALSFALGNFGSLYMSEHRVEEALYLTRLALIAAQRAKAAESLFRWHWQEGRLLWAQGDTNGAVRAHRRAVEIVEQSRQQILTRYGAKAHYFDQTIAPIYRDLVEVLLLSAQLLRNDGNYQTLLVEARNVIEKYKAAELRDYFRNECVAEFAAKTTRLEAVSPTAVVVYPIMLPTRLVLLVSLPDGIKQYTVQVPQSELVQTIRQFRYHLEGIDKKQQHQALGQKLYQWLVSPYTQALGNTKIDTLVFVPDGALRTVPLAALHDGQDYLIRRYTVATSLGLSLTDPRPIDVDNASVLLAGISKPSQGFSALPTVTQELQSIERLFDSEVLLDRDFTLNDFNAALEEPKTIVHIASHAQFLSNSENSFILTFDGHLPMNRMNEFLSRGKYRQHALELLFLSACQTAADDNRAALGLAGAGIKAGARSAVGSLWDISDSGATKLVGEFYKQLKHRKVSKAKALQLAQLKLLDDPEYAHPFFWSSFLLINNWL